MAKIAETEGDADAVPTPKSAGKKRGKATTDDEATPAKKTKTSQRKLSPSHSLVTLQLVLSYCTIVILC